MDTFLRWAGSKKQLLRRLDAFWNPRDRTYIEPFAGSASLFFHLNPPRAILGDLNTDLIGALRAIRLDAQRVIECVHRLPLGSQAYYSIRRMEPQRLSEAERAARFLYLNFYCFNGLYRTNLAGQFNVPYGRKKGRKTISDAQVLAASDRLRNTVLICGDFEDTVKYAAKGNFVYLDPPYVTDEERRFTEYLPGSFSVDDMERLSVTLHDLDYRGVKFVVSYQDSTYSREALAPWLRYRVWVRRNIAGFAGHRRGVYELLATNITSNTVSHGH